MDAVEDLAMLPWYMRMSSDISDANSFYYYGERSSAGQPDGTGIACYADNAYYYGEWSNGKREGNGKWVRFYVYYDDDTTSDRAYREHMYAGEWKNDLPDGEGQEHYELDMSKAAKKERYIQNVIGTFRSGFYTIGTAAEVDGIQVSFHDLVLGHLFLKLESKIPLLELTLESLHHICLGTTVEYSELDQLLGDGTGTF